MPEETHSNLKMLISLLLNKDYQKRPNIFEFARIPCVNKAIKKFVEDNNLQSEVLNIFDMGTAASAESDKNRAATENSKEAEAEQEDDGHISRFQEEQLEELAELMRCDIHIQDYKYGWLSRHYRCAQGRDIYRWILEHAEENERKAWGLC